MTSIKEIKKTLNYYECKRNSGSMLAEIYCEHVNFLFQEIERLEGREKIHNKLEAELQKDISRLSQALAEIKESIQHYFSYPDKKKAST